MHAFSARISGRLPPQRGAGFSLWDLSLWDLRAGPQTVLDVADSS
jgi:hypothetical protein